MPGVVVFQDNKASTSAQVFSKSQKRAFMARHHYHHPSLRLIQLVIESI
jgi:hypothetical protein